MDQIKKLKKRGRKKMKNQDKVVSKPVYLTSKDWDFIIDKYESPTKAMKQLVDC
jgi:hypothetical protein